MADRPTDDAAATDGGAPTIAAQLAALNGGPLDPMTDEQAALFKTVSAWYLARCAELASRGVVPPPNILLAVLACAHEVVSYNAALQQAQLDAMSHELPPETRH